MTREQHAAAIKATIPAGIEALVIEWRDAREAILLVNWGGLGPDELRAHQPLWKRLGNAETALMARARTIVGDPPEPGWNEDPFTTHPNRRIAP